VNRKWEQSVAEAPFGSDAWLNEISWLYNFSEPGITELNFYQRKSEFVATFQRENRKSTLLFYRKVVVRVPLQEIAITQNALVLDGETFEFKVSGTAFPSIHGSLKARSRLAE
jgi:hypothetical protein